MINLAPSGSETAVYIIGMVVVAETTDCADGVEIATIASGLSPTNCLAIWPAVAVLPCAL